MVHPVKTPLAAARVVTHASLQAVRHPLRTVGDVASLGRGLVSSVAGAARSDAVAAVVESDEPVASPAPTDETSTLKRQGDPVTRAEHAADDTAETAGTAETTSDGTAGDTSGPEGAAGSADAAAETASGPEIPEGVDLAELGRQVVLEAAEEAPETEDAPAVVTEPSAVTGPGDEDEIPSSVVDPREDEDVEVTTPVGTTGAGVAFNPDTAETDLQQPGTEPLMDPSTTKRVKGESDTLRRASSTEKR